MFKKAIMKSNFGQCTKLRKWKEKHYEANKSSHSSSSALKPPSKCDDEG